MIKIEQIYIRLIQKNGFLLLIVFIFGATAFAQTQAGTNGFAEVNGTKLHYELTGKGEKTVVLIHGGLSDSRIWDDQVKSFAKRYRVVRYDLRGFGKSEFPTTAYSHIEDLYALLKFLKIDRAAFVGLSLGGIIAVDFALEYPEMVITLVLVSSGLRGHPQAGNPLSAEVTKVAEEQGMEKAIQKWLEHPFFASGKGNERFQRRMREMLADNYRYWGPTPATIIVNYPLPLSVERLSNIKVPTLVVAGESDASNILAIADTLTAKITGAKKQVISKAGHHLTMEKAKEFNKIVLKFLKENLSIRAGRQSAGVF